MKSSNEVRAKFLDFFEGKGHKVVESAPIVVKNDPTLMFINAGMNQFKDLFLGTKTSPDTRITDTQKCMRVSGKHNDLDDVGHDTYHHTMFEMLGNWSFGDYYKNEAISWAWELLTQELGLDKDRLYITVFGGDEEMGLNEDSEARKIWQQYLPDDRILNFDKKDNFWMMGDTGPCGPCSEIHIDVRSDEDRAKIDGRTLVNADDPELIEIWNLVFIQYNAKADKSLEELSQKHVDTGMGFERLLMVLQDKKSTYDTDLFEPSRTFLKTKTGIDYFSADLETQIAMRVVMDHIRAISFAIADGQVPSNTGAGYVIRRILRRASRYAFTYLGLSTPFLYEMVDLLVKKYSGAFKELDAQQDFIKRLIEQEEKSFLSKLEKGSKMFEDYLSSKPNNKSIDGDFAFKLYDTYGFPIDLTQLMAREKGLSVDMDAFQKQLEAQKTRSRAATLIKTGDWVDVHASEELPRFLGYDTLELESRIIRYRSIEVKGKKQFQIVLEETPFYAESGGQIGDRGTLNSGDEQLRVLDTKKENELIVHFVDKLPADASGSWNATVNKTFREKVIANHSATHLMHAALRQVLGTHVEQRGSLVSDKVLRFDFSHFEKVTDEQLVEIERIVNAKIAAGIALNEYREMPIKEAKKMGAMALFGEKYGENVRVVIFDPTYSIELCGGVHVQNTRDIRLFKFVSEGSVAAGIRRVEAYTGSQAIAYFEKQVAMLNKIKLALKGAKDPVKAVTDLVESQKQMEKELRGLRAEKTGRLKGELLKLAKDANGIQLIAQQVDLATADDLKQLSFELRAACQNTLIVLGAKINEKALLSVIMSTDLEKSGKYNAGSMIQEIAREVKGGGGGQAFYATAGGKDPSGISAALAKAEELIVNC